MAIVGLLEPSEVMEVVGVPVVMLRVFKMLNPDRVASPKGVRLVLGQDVREGLSKELLSR